MLRDVVRVRDPELMFNISLYHDPCACGDLYSRTTETFACTVTSGELVCADSVTTAVDMHLADIWSWTSTLKIRRDGTATRVVGATKEVSRAKKKTLASSVKLRFHR